MLKGIIIKGIGGFYYVKTANQVIQCRAKGAFRKEKVKPLVGDNVEIRLTNEDDTGYIEKIDKRTTELIRPAVANVNQAVIVFSVKNPNPNLWLLDRFLLLAMHQELDIIICFNKIDIASEEEIILLNQIYEKTDHTIINTSTKHGTGIEQLKDALKNKISVFSGPSGVGKSTLLNKIQPGLELETGEISKKTNTGKHTTRAAELLELNMGGWVVDTPGFSSLDVDFIDTDNLDYYFDEIYAYSHGCKFIGCVHEKEPECSVKEAVKEGKISQNRYKNYLRFKEELSGNRRY